MSHYNAKLTSVGAGSVAIAPAVRCSNGLCRICQYRLREAPKPKARQYIMHDDYKACGNAIYADWGFSERFPH